jgi:tetratricopeptide (TPR) repeat protein
MPSHIFLRAGRYKQGVDVNTKAVNSYRQSVPLYAPVAGADFLYVIHNLHMKTNNAMMLGNYTMAINAAQETQKNIPADYLSIPAPMGSYVQYINMSPVFVYIRFGKWNEILQIPKPAAQQVYANTLYHFARGMAFAATQKIDNAKLELKYLNETMKDSSLAVPFSPFAAAIEGATVAQNLLTGTIALKEQQLKNAITAFEKAVVTESNMLYNEPRDWMLSPAHFSGNALLLNNDGKTAEQIFTQDLKNNNENGWALYGLYKAMLLQNKKTAAAAVLKRYNRAFKNADVKLEAPVF